MRESGSIYAVNQRIISRSTARRSNTVDLNLHSPGRRLIELKIEHADLNALVDLTAHARPIDELLLRRLKKRSLLLRDEIFRLELQLNPPEPA